MASITSTNEAEQNTHPNEAINQPDYQPRVFFNEFNADSLNILAIYWYHPPDYWEYYDQRNRTPSRVDTNGTRSRWR